MKKGVLKNFTNSTQKRLRWSLFLIKRQDFWLATLLKRDTNTGVFLREHSEIFKNAYFEVEILENEIYSCFFVSKVIHSVLGKVKKEYWNSFIVKGIWTVWNTNPTFSIFETEFPHSHYYWIWLVKSIEFSSHPPSIQHFFQYLYQEKRSTWIYFWPMFTSLLLYSGKKTEHWPEMK